MTQTPNNFTLDQLSKMPGMTVAKACKVIAKRLVEENGLSDVNKPPTGRGGARVNAGRKPVSVSGKAKVLRSYKLDPEVLEKLEELSVESGHSKATIIEWSIRRITKLPKNI